MKQFFYLLLLIIIAGATPAHAQNKRVKYTYDATGNRTKREPVIYMPMGASSISTERSSVAVQEPVQPVSFEEALAERKIIIYPNPTKGALRVDITGGEVPRGARIFLYNASGTPVRQWNNITSSTAMDISGEPAGLYLMHIILDDQHVSIWKIVKEQ